VGKISRKGRPGMKDRVGDGKLIIISRPITVSGMNDLFIQPRWQLRRTYFFNHYNVLF